MEIPDFYQTLNIPHNSSPEIVEREFNHLSKNYSTKSLGNNEDRNRYSKLFTAYYILYQKEPRMVYEECIDKLSDKSKDNFTDYEVSLYERFNALLKDAKRNSFRSLRTSTGKIIDKSIIIIFSLEFVGSILTGEFLNHAVLGPLSIIIGIIFINFPKIDSIINAVIGAILIAYGILMIRYKIIAIKRDEKFV